MPIATNRTVAALLEVEMQELYLKYGNAQPLRTGLHASSLLVSEADWCTRKHVLAELYPEQAEKLPLAYWQWKMQAVFENGWDLHKRWQKLFKEHFQSVVCQKDEFFEWDYELDLTHYDEDRHIYFSPDAILSYAGIQYVVEIKGINHDAYQSLTDDLEQAMRACETVEKAFYQCQLYLHLLSLQYGIILVENKNNQNFRLWVIEYDKNLAMPYVHRAYQVKGGVSLAKRFGSGKLPTRTCTSAQDSKARKCPLARKCFEEGLS